MSDFLLCCDWGTSQLRLQLVQTEPFKILTQIAEPHGVAQAHRLWEEQSSNSNVDSPERIAFFEKFLRQAARKLEEVSGLNLSSHPLIVSGMASSSLGIKDLPCASLPFALSGESIEAEWLPSTPTFDHDVLLVSGVKSATDIIRGAETQMIGLSHTSEAYVTDALFILPGTNSKHIHVKTGNILDFQSYMTGELFHALSEHTVLRDSVRKSARYDGSQVQAFRKGVYAAAKGDLLRDLFSARARDLLGETSAEENYHYLSGLLIGHELRSLGSHDLPLVLACDETLLPAYKEAITCLGFTERTRMLPPQIVNEAAARGQLQVYHAVNERRTAAPPSPSTVPA